MSAQRELAAARERRIRRLELVGIFACVILGAAASFAAGAAVQFAFAIIR